jgi:hypothetical protein
MLKTLWVKRIPLFPLGLVAILVAGFLGCRETQPRTYSEVAFKANPSSSGMMGQGPMGQAGMNPMMNTSPVDIKVTWTLPGNWMIKDSANGMRIGSFAVGDPSLMNTGEVDPKAIDISVVQLAGDAGGLQANIQRWMGQVSIKASPEEMADLIKSSKKFKTRSGQEGMYVDLTDKLSGDMTQSKTIFGAVIQTADYTVFVKGTGDRVRVLKIIPEIKTFCESLSITGPKS